MDAPIFLGQLLIIAALGVCFIALAVVDMLRDVPPDYFTYRGRR